MTVRGQRLYDWWSEHPLVQRLLYAVAFFGQEAAFRRRGVDALALEPGERVLDLGCGPGTNFEALRDGVGPAGAVVGLDYSAGMVAQARQRISEHGWENVHVVRGDATELGVTTDAFDAVYASMSVSAMPDVAAVLERVGRALRPDGRFVVLDAQPFQERPWTLLNPLLAVIFSKTTNWNPEFDVPARLRADFDSVTVTPYYGESIFVATAREFRGVETD